MQQRPQPKRGAFRISLLGQVQLAHSTIAEQVYDAEQDAGADERHHQTAHTKGIHVDVRGILAEEIEYDAASQCADATDDAGAQCASVIAGQPPTAPANSRTDSGLIFSINC